jgi:nitrite reductase (NADH) small subunit
MTQLTVCKINDIIPETGVCALVNGKQVAIFCTQSYLRLIIMTRSVKPTSCLEV